MKAGDIFYTKKSRNAPASKLLKLSYIEQTYKGHLVAMMLGHVPQDTQPPDANTIHQLVAEIGLVKFDDVEEALGTEAVEKLMKHVETKYASTGAS